MKEKGLSPGAFQSVCRAVGGMNALIDPDCKDRDLLALVTYITDSQKAEKVLENQNAIKQPIVRNEKKDTVGFNSDVWKAWMQED